MIPAKQPAPEQDECDAPTRGQIYVGARFGKWSVVRKAHKKYMWLCVCDCGVWQDVCEHPLRGGRSKSCRKCANVARATHGRANTRLFRIWAGMRKRCTNPNAVGFELYGGRGVAVCVEWNDFQPFYDWAVSHDYADNLSLDRFPDKDGNYEPTNCRWATDIEQSRNKRNNRLVTHAGETKTLAEWGEITGLGSQVIKDRLDKLHWTPDRALTVPVRFQAGRD